MAYTITSKIRKKNARTTIKTIEGDGYTFKIRGNDFTFEINVSQMRNGDGTKFNHCNISVCEVTQEGVERNLRKVFDGVPWKIPASINTMEGMLGNYAVRPLFEEDPTFTDDPDDDDDESSDDEIEHDEEPPYEDDEPLQAE